MSSLYGLKYKIWSMLMSVAALIPNLQKQMLLSIKKNFCFSGVYLPLICHMARPVAICWQIHNTGLKLHS